MKTLLEHVLKNCLIFTATIYRLKSMQKILLYCFRIGKPQHRQNHWATSHSRYPSYSHLSSKLVALVCNPVRLGHFKKKNLSISPSAGLMSQKKKHCLQITSSSTTPCKLLFFLVTIFLPHVNLKLVQTHLCSSLYGELTIQFFLTFTQTSDTHFLCCLWKHQQWKKKPKNNNNHSQMYTLFLYRHFSLHVKSFFK